MLHGGAWIWILCSSGKNNMPLEHKIYIFELTCSFLFIISIIDIQGKDWKAGCYLNTVFIQTKYPIPKLWSRFTYNTAC